MNSQYSQTVIKRDEIDLVPQRNKQYLKTNAYSQSASLQQVLTIIIFVVITILHGVFITSAAAVIGSSILWTLVGLTYLLLILICYDYCYLTCSDPVDDLILKIKKNYKESELLYCNQCNAQVHVKSHHCKKCNRCSQYFDHHCKYLNNCIGGKNYHPFLRMLIAVTAFCITIMGAAVWVFIVDSRDASISILSKWGALVTLILAFIAMVAVDSLLCFHFYLIFYLKSTTLQYIRNLPDSQQNN